MQMWRFGYTQADFSIFILLRFENIKTEELQVRCGEWDIHKDVELFEPQDRIVKDYAFHPQFNPSQLYHDMALLFVDDFELDEPHLNTVCLPKDVGGLVNYDSTSCKVLGWGKRAEIVLAGDLDEELPQASMKAVTLPIVDHDTCQKGFQEKVNERFSLNENFICAGGNEGVDACEGDGGGPLVCPITGTENRYSITFMFFLPNHKSTISQFQVCSGWSSRGRG